MIKQTVGHRTGGRPFDKNLSRLAGMIIGMALLATSPLSGAPLLDSRSQGDEVAVPAGLQGHVLRDVLRRLNAGEVEIAIAKTKAVIDRHGENAAALELLGAALALNGDLDLAVAKLERAIKLNPSQGSAYTKLGDIFAARGQDDQAEAAFRKAIELNALDRRAHQRLGLMLEKGGAVDAAIDHLRQGLVGLPADYVGIKVNLARLYNLRGDHEEALELLDGRLSPELDDAKSFVIRGTSKLGLDAGDGAIDDFETAKALAPDDAGVLLAEGIAFRKMGRDADSRRVLEAAIHHRPDWSLGLFQLAMTKRSLGDHDQAIETLDRALATDPGAIAPRIERARYALEREGLKAAVDVFERGWPKDEATPHVFGRIGKKLQLAGEHDLAEAVLIAGTGRFADNAVSHHQLGRHYGFVRRYDQAIPALEAATERAPDDPEILKTLSLAYQRQGALPKAIDVAVRLTEVTDEDVGHKFYLASLRDDHGQKEEAKRLYHQILEEDAGHVATLNNLASLLLDDAPEKALPLATRAADLAPEASYVIDTFGMALLAAGRTNEAIEALSRANELTPDDPILLYHLGQARHEAGEVDEARASLKQALALSADFDGADEAQALLAALN